MSASDATCRVRLECFAIRITGPPRAAKVPGLSQNPPGKSKRQAAEIRAEGVGQVGAGQGKFDGGLEETELLAGVVSLALELDRVDRPLRAQHPEPVGELDLAP